MSSLGRSSSKLFSNVHSQENNEYKTFEKNLVDTLNNQVPKKSKPFEVNRSLDFKILRNAIMKRSK